jgi:hypothetical protein
LQHKHKKENTKKSKKNGRSSDESNLPCLGVGNQGLARMNTCRVGTVAESLKHNKKKENHKKRRKKLRRKQPTMPWGGGIPVVVENQRLERLSLICVR